MRERDRFGSDFPAVLSESLNFIFALELIASASGARVILEGTEGERGECKEDAMGGGLAGKTFREREEEDAFEVRIGDLIEVWVIRVGE